MGLMDDVFTASLAASLVNSRVASDQEEIGYQRAKTDEETGKKIGAKEASVATLEWIKSHRDACDRSTSAGDAVWMKLDELVSGLQSSIAKIG